MILERTANFSKGETARGLPLCLAYINTFLVASVDADEHESHLTELFRRLDDNGTVFILLECKFSIVVFDFLWYIISSIFITAFCDSQAYHKYSANFCNPALHCFLALNNF